MSKQASDNKYRFIPYRKNDIVEMCIQDNRLLGKEDDFRHLSHKLSILFHLEFHQVIESLKNSYASVDPDSDTRQTGLTKHQPEKNFVDILSGLLEKANFERITEAELSQALNKSSLFKISLHVDFDDFSEILLFCRGESSKQESVSSWMGLRKKTIDFINYERVIVYIRFKDDYEQSKDQLPSCKPGSTLIRLFQNVPKADLEMLFPNTRIRMRTIDKLLIGIPALVSGGIVITTKLGASLIIVGSLLGFWLGLSNQAVELNKTALMALLAGLVALGAYLWKQFNNFKNRKLKFMQSLTQNLYFKNLDNNAGVFHRLVNDAEEEECKEAILAYYFLLVSDKPLSKTNLDHNIETWMMKKWGCSINFEIDDALEKLLALELIQDSNGKFTAITIDSGKKNLDQRWADYL